MKETLEKLSEKIKPVSFEFTDDLYAKIDRFTLEIWDVQWQRKGRTYKQIKYNCMSGILLEHAAALVLNGEVNPHQFDHTDKKTYIWDVRAGENLFEIKRQKMDQGAKWFSFYKSNIKTFMNNYRDLDYLLVGDWVMDKNTINVDWLLLADAPSFMKNIKKSVYIDGQFYYNHINNLCRKFK